MNFKEEKKEVQTSLAMDRDAVHGAITNLVSAVIPLKNKLAVKTDEDLEALYPKKHAAAKAVRDWLAENSADVNTKLAELKNLLKEKDDDE